MLYENNVDKNKISLDKAIYIIFKNYNIYYIYIYIS